jgi:hypothetical protein
MQLTLRDNLLFIAVRVSYRGAEIEIPNVLVDTGSASTILAADMLAMIGVVPEPQDTLVKLYGVGGTESVFARRMDRLQVGDQALGSFEINVGAMDHGFEINGILGTDFLVAAGAVINLRSLEMDFQPFSAHPKGL